MAITHAPADAAPSQTAAVPAALGAETSSPVEGQTVSNSSSLVYWPPLSPFATYLDKLKFELATLPTLSASSREFLDLYSDALRQGLGKVFRRRGADGAPSSVGSFLEQQKPARTVTFPKYISSPQSPSLGVIERRGGVEVVVDAEMEERAEEVSRNLDLDPRQSLYLVWMDCMDRSDVRGYGDVESGNNKRVKTGVGVQLGVSKQVTPLRSYSLASVCQLYCDERLSLLRALETILWIGEDPVAVSEVRDYVETRLIDGVLFGKGQGSLDVEEVLFRDLKAGINSFRSTIAYKAVVVAKGNSEDVNWAKVLVQGLKKERFKMLTLLALVYYRPRKACGVERFEELLTLAASGGASSPMYILLLLEIIGLEIGGPLRAVAEGGNGGLDNESTSPTYPFLAAGVVERITDRVREMVVNASSDKADEGYVSVLVLTWASILLVLSDNAQVRQMGGDLAQLCSVHGASTLHHLSLVSCSPSSTSSPASPQDFSEECPQENSKQMTQLSSLILYHSLAIFLAAFDVGENEPMKDQVVTILEALLCQASVNDMFLYNHDDALTQPLLRFMDSLDPMGAQQVKLLTSISSTSAGSVFAGSYLRKISHGPHVAMLSLLRQLMQCNDTLSFAHASVILGFYDAMCSSNAVTVIELLDVKVESDDFISVLGMCIARAPPAESSDILTLAFKLLSYFVPYSPNRVLGEVMSSTGVSPVSFKLEFFDRMMSSASTKSSYQAVMAVFQLVSVLLQTAYGPRRAAVMMSMNMIGIAVPYISCMASSEEKWNLAAGCLTVVRHALMRSDDPLRQSGGSAAAAAADTAASPVSKKVVLELISPILPPDCTTIANDVEHQGETEAIEKCVIKWLRLVPVLLSEGPPVYEYLFQSVNGRNPPAATLLSYLSYPYFGSEDKAAVVRSMAHLLSYDSNVPVTAFLPKDGPRLSLLEPCMVIANAINVESPTHVDSLFSAACDVLCNAVSYHPTLAVLLLPDVSVSSLGGSSTTSTTDSATASNVPECSCTHHILGFAERASDMYVSNPRRLEKVLDVICAAITSKKSRNGIMTSLIPNEKIWAAFMSILLRSAGDADDIQGNGNDDEIVDARRFHVEMKVMDIFVAAMCSAEGQSSKGTGDKSSTADLWKYVDIPIKKHFALVSRVLLRKYCRLIQRMNIWEEMLQARRLAWLAGLHIMAFALDNNGLYDSLKYEQNSLIAELWTCILRSDVRVVNPNRDTLVKLCQALYDSFLSLETDESGASTTLYKDPYLPMANLLLELRDGPLPLPNQIGSAWGKLINDFPLLDSQTKRLSELLRLQGYLFECITSLDAFIAVCADRYPSVFASDGKSEAVADLNDIIDVVESATEGSLQFSQETLIEEGITSSIDAALVSCSRLAVLLSQQPDAHIVDERRFFEMLASLVDHQGVEFVDRSLANWLTVGINLLSTMGHRVADTMETSEREELAGILPRLLPLTVAASPRVACTASSLAMVLMASRVRPAAWEELVECLNITQMLTTLATHGYDMNQNKVSPDEATLRIKSLLLLVSQMISESDRIASTLVSRGLGDAIVSVCRWVADLLPLIGCAANNATGISGVDPSISDDDDRSNKEFLLDFAGRYTDTGIRYEVHSVWCIVLSLCSLLSSALPGHRKVQTLLLRVSVSMADRIGQSLIPLSDTPERGPQFVTLGYVEEGRAVLGFLCALARLEGEWLLNQPKMSFQARQLTAKFLEFAARDVHNASFAAISPEELRRNSHLPSMGQHVRTPVLFGADPVLQLSVMGEPVGEAVAEVTELSLAMAGHFYAMIKYALDFQLISAPEICETEAMHLTEKNTWVQTQTLVDLSTTAASILESLCDDRDSCRLDSVKALAWRLIEISQNAAALLARTSPQPQLASSLCTSAAEKMKSVLAAL